MIAESRLKTPSPSRRLCTRAGIATLKIILLIPVVITLLVMVLEVANLWIARVEFENALESAALAAAKDWGDDHGASGTLTPREVGNEFAKSNTVRKTGVNLSSIDPSLNYDNSDPVNNPNQNTTYPNGVLLFGAITDLDPQVIFNAAVQPACGGGGSLLFDVSEQGNTGLDHAWGISFRATDDPTVNANLRVDRIVIDLDPSGTGTGRFNFTSTAPVLSDNSPQPAVRDSSSTDQDDNFGFDLAPAAPVTQIAFTPTTGTPTQLEITFSGSGSDAGFSPGDRFRFGALVETLQGGTYQQADGDDIGQLSAKVSVYFSNGGVPIATPSEGFYFDNMTRGLDGSNDCFNPATPFTDPLGNLHVLVHGRQIADLPCPPTSSASNNGQSFVEVDGQAQTRKFAVKVQGQIEVPMVISELFGCDFGPFTIQAEATAYYNCEERRPCLIRVDQTLNVAPGS